MTSEWSVARPVRTGRTWTFFPDRHLHQERVPCLAPCRGHTVVPRATFRGASKAQGRVFYEAQLTDAETGRSRGRQPTPFEQNGGRRRDAVRRLGADLGTSARPSRSVLSDSVAVRHAAGPYGGADPSRTGTTTTKPGVIFISPEPFGITVRYSEFEFLSSISMARNNLLPSRTELTR